MVELPRVRRRAVSEDQVRSVRHNRTVALMEKGQKCFDISKYEILVLLETFSWLLTRYRELVDPASYESACLIYHDLKLETRGIAEAELAPYLEHLACLIDALAKAVCEWRGVVEN